MPKQKGLSRILIHWTGGAYLPNSIDRSKYHFLIGWDDETKKPFLVKGNFAPEDNIDCKDGKYAPHVHLANTGSIGIAFCGMLGFKNSLNLGDYPLIDAQTEFGYKFIAEICKKYNIPVSPLTVITHYEWGLAHPNTDNRGKRDINFITSEPNLNPDKVGDFIRNKVNWYYKKGAK